MLDLPAITITADGPTADGSSPELLQQLLAEVDRLLDEVGVDIDGWFQPGLTPMEIREPLDEVGLECPEELVVWFGWHNGYRSSGRPAGDPPLPNMTMGPLDDAVLRYRQSRAFLPPVPAQEGFGTIDFEFGAGEGWLRLGSDSEGVAIDTRGSTPPRIRYANGDFEYAPPTMFRAVSLCTITTWLLIGLRSGAYVWNAAWGSWIVDAEKLAPSQLDARFW